MKRQDSLPDSSSSHRENAAEKLHAKAVGCMSGFFHLVSGSHSRRRKFLTFGKKQEKNTKHDSSPKIENENSPPLMVTGQTKLAKDLENKATINVLKRFSCEVPRSPTLPAEIRRSNSVNSQKNFRAPPTLMARLMGLEEAPAATPKALSPRSSTSANIRTAPPSEYSGADQKRRQLIGALEKCDRDLKALKKVIDAVRSVERLPSLPPEGGRVGKRSHGVKGLEVISNNLNAEQQPSPVSVLDEFMARSPLSTYQFSKRHSYNHASGR
ncbi:hypothetical protein TIFTF001_029921 [Ficus carica]|uniref:DUF3741 domain-containing protein n=1 Tax=Ficus carica TaxID=3494 RepID=A0AA88DSH5_FICCA|nr:hypothetical protein TIFTF001_029921 [Ficus carica]